MQNNQQSEMVDVQLTRRQFEIFKAMLHSSMTEDYISEQVEDENWDAGYEDEWKQLQEKYPDDEVAAAKNLTRQIGDEFLGQGHEEIDPWDDGDEDYLEMPDDPKDV